MLDDGDGDGLTKALDECFTELRSIRLRMDRACAVGGRIEPQLLAEWAAAYRTYREAIAAWKRRLTCRGPLLSNPDGWPPSST